MPNPSYTPGVTPANYVPNNISELGNMIGKVAEQVIREVTANDKLSVFDKMPVENGDTIEQAVVKLASPRAYDSTGANALSRKTPDIAVRYFSEWTREVFDTTVDMSLIRKVLQTGKGASELSTKIVGVLSESDKYAKYSYAKDLLAWGRQDGQGQVLKQLVEVELDSNSEMDYKGALVKLKNTISGMQYVNDDFNTAAIKRKTDRNDIYVLIPYKLKNRLDVNELSGVFNLDKDKIDAHIIELDLEPVKIPVGGVDRYWYPVYVVDKFAILDYTRLYEMADQKNADGLFWNYFLHTERLYGISPLFDACYFFVECETAQG